MAGRFPPRPPRILDGFPDFSHRSWRPIGSSHVQQCGKGLDFNRYELPAFSTLGFLHERGLSNRLLRDPDASHRTRRRLLPVRRG